MDCRGCGHLRTLFLQGHPFQGIALRVVCRHRSVWLFQVEKNDGDQQSLNYSLNSIDNSIIYSYFCTQISKWQMISIQKTFQIAIRKRKSALCHRGL